MNIKYNYIIRKGRKMATKFIFNNDELFSEPLKEKIIEKFNNSNIIKSKLNEDGNIVELSLKKDGSHEYNMSLNIKLSKITNDIHLNSKGTDAYNLVNQLIDKLETKFVKLKQ